MDLFSGPGIYRDGTLSTPVLVLNSAISNAKLAQRLNTIFNDVKREYVHELTQNIKQISGIENLLHEPQIFNREITSQALREFIGLMKGPTLSFVDPWGYKGLSLDLVRNLTHGFGCDCILFFNYLRINPGLNNPVFAKNMEALFGRQRATELRPRLEAMSPEQRELTIVEEFAQAIKDTGREYVLPFRFMDEAGHRLTHHLILVSKGYKAFEIMRDIMDGESSSHQQGIASFCYNPADIRQPLLFQLSRPLDDLGNMLLAHFAGKRISFKQVFSEFNQGKLYSKKNYQEVLIKLEIHRKITAEPSAGRRKNKGLFTDNTAIIFPARR